MTSPSSSSCTAVIAFCSDEYMEAPLHVAAQSVLRSLNPAWTAKFYVLAEGISSGGLRRLQDTLNAVKRPYEIVPLGCDKSVFAGLRTLHGSLSTYYRFLLPDLIQEQRFLYLDTDTITNIDVAPLFAATMNGNVVGFVVNSKAKFALDRPFRISQGADPEDPAFNAGVMLLDNEGWHEQQWLSRILDFCKTHAQSLISHDQTVLNVFFAKSCFHLDEAFNVALSTVTRRPIPAQGLYHFVGSPKPWDLFGETFHPYGDLWKEAAAQTALSPRQKVSYLNLLNWKRFPRIAGGYRRTLRQRRQMVMDAKQKETEA